MVVVAVAVAWYVIVIIIICGVTYYILLMGSIYCCIKIIKEDAYNRGTYVCRYAFVCGIYMHIWY